MATAAETARRKSLVLHAISTFAKKEVDSRHLKPGKWRLSLTAAGSLGRAQVQMPVDGCLLIGENRTTTPTTAPPIEHLLALVLERLTDDDQVRARLLEQIPADFAANEQTLPAVSPVTIEGAKRLLQRLRVRGEPKTKRGDSTFQPT